MIERNTTDLRQLSIAFSPFTTDKADPSTTWLICKRLAVTVNNNQQKALKTKTRISMILPLYFESYFIFT